MITINVDESYEVDGYTKEQAQKIRDAVNTLREHFKLSGKKITMLAMPLGTKIDVSIIMENVKIGG